MGKKTTLCKLYSDLPLQGLPAIGITIHLNPNVCCQISYLKPCVSRSIVNPMYFIINHLPFNKMLSLALAIWYSLSYFIPWNTMSEAYCKLEVAVLYISLFPFPCSSMHRHDNFSRWASLDMCHGVPYLCQDSFIYLGVISFHYWAKKKYRILGMNIDPIHHDQGSNLSNHPGLSVDLHTVVCSCSM